MKNLVILTIATLFTASLVGSQPASAGDTPPGVTVDLSSPKAAIETFAAWENALKKMVEEEMESLFGKTRAELLAPILTEELKKVLGEMDGRSKRGREDKPMVFVREEKLEDGQVVVFTEQSRAQDPKEKKSEDPPRTNRFHLVQAGDEWRIVKWDRGCRGCKGSGKCQGCGGTGKPKPMECYACKGTGKRGEETCGSCDGTGKIMPKGDQECYRCKEAKGKCDWCKGVGWMDQLEFEKGGFFAEGNVPVEKFEDLSTPENTAKTYVSLKGQQVGDQAKALSILTAKVRHWIKSLFTAEILKRFEAGVRHSSERFIEEEAGAKREIGKAETAGETAIVVITETRTRRGKERVEKTALKLVNRDGKWLLLDLGRACYACKGTGRCGECEGTGTTKERECWRCKGTGKRGDYDCRSCEGTGKTKPSECYACKKTEGGCRSCGGDKFNWETKQLEKRKAWKDKK